MLQNRGVVTICAAEEAAAIEKAEQAAGVGGATGAAAATFRPGMMP